MTDRPWNDGDPTKPYSVTTWGSHPDAGNDDCWQGGDFASESEARIDFNLAILGDGYGVDRESTAYIMLDGPDLREIVAFGPYHTPAAQAARARRERAEREADRRERAMEAGMAFGCDGYNDAMGW